MLIYDRIATTSVLNPCKRTIFFEGRKFLLSLPKIVFTSTSEISYINVFNENSNLCYAPFPNIKHTIICTGRKFLRNSDEILSDFFTTEFKLTTNLDWVKNLDVYTNIIETKIGLSKTFESQYCHKHLEKVYNFYEKWQNDGKLNLIEL